RIIMSVIKEVAGDKKPRLVRDRPFATNGQPFVALHEAVQAFGDDVLGDCFVAPYAQREIAGLRAAEAARFAIDFPHGTILMRFGIEISVVGFALAIKGCYGALYYVAGCFHADLCEVAQRTKTGRGGEAGRFRRRLLRAYGKIVVTPAAVHRFIALQTVDLSGYDFLDPLLPLGISGTLVHFDQSLDRISV